MHFVSGDSFFVGVVFIVAGTLLRLFCQCSLFHKFLRMLSVVGMAFVLGSATPLSLWLYLFWFAFIVGIQLVLDKHMLTSLTRSGLGVALLLLSSVLFWGEYTYRRDPEIPMSNNDVVYVIGDSVSSGLDEGESPWPEVLAESMNLNLMNLARSGATVETAFQQAAFIQENAAVVFVEIGGNDVFGGTDSMTFHHHLARLLKTLYEDGHRIVMFELPLLPFYNRFGHIQRKLAERYEASLIPKAVMARVFGRADGTTDGIHLSQEGHNAMAERIGELISVQ